MIKEITILSARSREEVLSLKADPARLNPLSFGWITRDSYKARRELKSALRQIRPPMWFAE
jgi:hypothetical protein